MKNTLLVIVLFALAVAVSACAPDLETLQAGDVITAQSGVNGLTEHRGWGQETCSPHTGEQFEIMEIGTYGILGEISMNLQSLDRPGGWSLFSGLHEDCHGWTSPGDDHWDQ